MRRSTSCAALCACTAIAAVFGTAAHAAPAAPAASTAPAGWPARAAAAVAVIDGSLQVPGLRESVRVQRDRWGVAHIYAQNQHDLFFAQGFVVAQDRLYQMEIWKRSGQGRLAEILGPAAVARDAGARRLRYQGSLDAEYASYAPDTRDILEAFTAGINAYIAEAGRPGGRGLPVEFAIAGFEPEPWQPVDCLNRMAAYAMMGNAADELQHAAVLSRVGAAAATQLFDFDPPAPLDPAPGLDLSGLTPALLAGLMGSDSPVHVPVLHESNDWTIAGTLTASGKPLLANDPHRVIAQPSLRYMVHLVAPGWNVIGAGEPGLPGVADGHNEHIGWGFTIFGADQQDLYVEELDPDDPDRYRTPAGWQRMRVTRERIRVRGGAPVETAVKFTRHGPVLWQDGRRALALRWAGAEPGTAGYLGSLSLDRAQNWPQFEAAMQRWKSPPENIVYADRDGNVGEHSTGLVPWRKNWTGLLPVPGNGAYEWAGFIPIDQLPHRFNPPSGFIATANQKMIPDAYPYAVGYEWDEPVRYLRIREVLEAAASAGRAQRVEDMEALQTDVVSLPARALQNLVRQALVAGRAPHGEELQGLAQWLLDWDGALRADSSQAGLYEFWASELRTAVTARVVPDAARAARGLLPFAQVLTELARARGAVFGAEPDAARDALLFDSLRRAHAKLLALRGPDVRQWAWGALHRVTFRHSLDGAAAALFDRGPVARPGDDETVQATGAEDGSLDQSTGASYREIFDLADWDASVAINAPGQSGQPGSKHYDDLLPLWTEGRYFPLAYSRAAVDAATTDVLTLTP
jgi:penicillin amidase